MGKKKAEGEKIPKPPKRAATPFLLYRDMVYPEVKRKYPKISFAQHLKIIS